MTTRVLRFYGTELIEAPHHHTDQLYHDHAGESLTAFARRASTEGGRDQLTG